MYFPVLLGKVPIPANIVNSYPPWFTLQSMPPVPHHAELGDLVTQVYPWRHYSSTAIRSGHLPLWNFHTLIGAPLIANHQSAVFYPPNSLYYVLDLPRAWALTFVLRFLLAAVGCALFTRSLGCSRYGALAAGIIFATCGFLTGWNGWANSDSAVWLPLVLLSVDRIREGVTPLRIAAVAIAFAMPVLAGHPQIAFYICGFGFVYALYRLIWPSPAALSSASPRRSSYLGGLVAAGMLAIALTGVQLFPTLEWIGTLERDVKTRQLWGSRPLGEMISLFSRDHRFSPNTAGVAIPEGATYVGIIGLALALLAPLSRTKRGDVIFFGLVIIVTLQVIYGLWPGAWLAERLPVFRSLPNTRIILLADFSLAVLAALGLTAFQKELEEKRWLKIHWALFAVVMVVLVAGVAGVSRRTPSLPEGFPWMLSPSSSIVLAAAAFLLLVPMRFGKPSRRAALVLVVVAVEMVTFGYGHVPFIDRNFVFPTPDLYRWLDQEERPVFRMATVDETASANTAMVYGFDSPLGYDHATRMTKAMLGPLRSEGAPDSISADALTTAPRPLINLLNIRYLLTNEYRPGRELVAAMSDMRLVKSDGGAYLFRNDQALPRLFLVPSSGIRRLDDSTALATVHSPDFDPQSTVILPLQSDATAASGESAASEEMRVLWQEQRVNSFAARVQTAVRAIAVFSDLYYPGWKVFVDGREAPLLRANYALKAVEVGPGTSTVTFVYEPKSFAWGTAASVAAILALMGLVSGQLHLRRHKASSHTA